MHFPYRWTQLFPDVFSDSLYFLKNDLGFIQSLPDQNRFHVLIIEQRQQQAEQDKDQS